MSELVNPTTVASLLKLDLASLPADEKLDLQAKSFGSDSGAMPTRIFSDIPDLIRLLQPEQILADSATFDTWWTPKPIAKEKVGGVERLTKNEDDEILPPLKRRASSPTPIGFERKRRLSSSSSSMSSSSSSYGLGASCDLTERDEPAAPDVAPFQIPLPPSPLLSPTAGFMSGSPLFHFDYLFREPCPESIQCTSKLGSGDSYSLFSHDLFE